MSIKKQNDAKMKIAVIGCGMISQTHLQVIQNNKNCSLIAVVDTSAVRAKSVAAQFKCRGYTDLDEMCDKEEIDIAMVCTPPNMHLPVCLKLIEGGIHVLCEKPLALTYEDGQKMIELAGKKKVSFMMASKFRYVEDIIKAKGIIESGILGEIVLFENIFCSHVNMGDRWNSQPEISGGGVLIDNGTHSVDIARFLLGSIKRIQAQEGKRIQSLDVEDTVRVYFETDTNILGTADLSWTIHKELEYFINIYGSSGSLSIGWKNSRYRQSERLDWIVFGKGYNKFKALDSQLNNFINYIHKKDKPLINEIDALESIKVVENAYHSMKMDKWVKIS